MRNAQQKEKLLSSDFDGFKLDSILQKLENPSIEPGYKDPRNCLVFWGRPTQKVKEMVSTIQQELRTIAPSTSISTVGTDQSSNKAHNN